MSISDFDLEQGEYGDRRRSDVSVYYSDSEEVRSSFSYFYSTESYEEEDEEEEDEEEEESRIVCRICHMGVELSISSGGIELGCCCKHDLAIAHKQCAETWFKIKGDKVCEICQSVARNVGAATEMVRPTEEEEGALRNNGEETVTVTATAAVELESGGQRWQPQKIVNLVLACMVFGFFISWLFHFHVSSSS